jgi:hypothetical protein
VSGLTTSTSKAGEDGGDGVIVELAKTDESPSHFDSDGTLGVSVMVLLRFGEMESEKNGERVSSTLTLLFRSPSDQFACNISEDIIVSAAHTLVDSGLAKLGYNYVL